MEIKDRRALKVALGIMKFLKFLTSSFFFGFIIALIYYFIWSYVNYDFNAAIGLVVSHAVVMKFLRPIIFDSENDDGLRQDIQNEINSLKKQIMDFDKQ